MWMWAIWEMIERTIIATLHRKGARSKLMIKHRDTCQNWPGVQQHHQDKDKDAAVISKSYLKLQQLDIQNLRRNRTETNAYLNRMPRNSEWNEQNTV